MLSERAQHWAIRPPKGAIVLFDGSNTEAWENGKLVEKTCSALPMRRRSKSLATTRCTSSSARRSCQLKAAKASGDRGVYIQSRYECQVLDSFGLEGEDNECGGIYSIARPAVNMYYPPLAWQTYDVDFTAARYDKHGSKTKNAAHDDQA